MVAGPTAIKREILANRLTRGSAHETINVGETERWLSLAGGGVLTLYGLQKGSWSGFGLALLGGALVYRGLSGHCACYGTLNLTTARHGDAAAVAAGQGVKVIRAVTINRPAEDLYRHWRNFENLPQFMSHLVSIRSEGANRSHWAARGPAGTTVEWDAEIVNEEPNRLIAWRSLEGSQIPTAGSVHFTPMGFNRGTEVRVVLKYDPPGGKLGSWLAWLFGQEPGQQIHEDLRRFKQLMETGQPVA